MDDLRTVWQLRSERRAHDQTRWWLFGVGLILLAHIVFDVFLLLR